MNFEIKKESSKSKARIGLLHTAHGDVNTPIFMPVGTVGSVKGVSPEELRDTGAEIILGNTYHLYLRPGEKLIKKMGDLQKYNQWNGPILTDSGGFQVFSLGAKMQGTLGHKLVKITEKGVEFKSHLDGSKHLFTPEKVIDIQLALGSDIIMVLDICTEFPANRRRAEQAMEQTHRWAKRAIDYWNELKAKKANSKNVSKNSKLYNIDKKMLFGICQGSTYKDLRIASAKYISSLGFNGIAVGGVSVGEGKKHMYEVIRWVAPYLAKDKPHYLMGVGEPEDLEYAIAYGFDMFDCVLPTRLARHGAFWQEDKTNKIGFVKRNIRQSQYRLDKKVLEKGCFCYACKNKFTRSYISHLVREKEMFGLRMLSIHNIHFLLNLVRKIRTKIAKNLY